MRLSNAGSLVLGFGDGGIVSVPPWAATTQTTGIGLQDDGKIVVAGSLTLPWLPPGEGGHAVFIARFTDRGFFDATFGGTGVVTPRVQRDAIRPSVALQADGKLLLAGAEAAAPPFGPQQFPFGPQQLFVARFISDGSPDLHFAGAGIAFPPGRARRGRRARQGPP